MLLIKPVWVHHTKGTPIYSIHWHPDNQRFVTAGDSVKVWSVLSLFKESTDKDEKGHKLLCTISYHIGSVNCARFSVDGRFLATGGDDKSVILCEVKTGYATKVFGSSDKNYENWVIRKTFKGHSADVVDLAWKPKGAPLLASASLDSTVIVWNSATLEQQAVLRGHTNMVKGVSWDPIGEFIATQSDDRSVIIWRTRDWSIEARITRGFENTSSSTFFRRPSWSPDGSYIVAAHARKDKLPVAAVIKRNSWALAYGFVGHERPVSVVSWNRHFYNAVDKPTAYCAVGGQDNALTIWSNRKARAVVGARDIFADSIVDLAWYGRSLERHTPFQGSLPGRSGEGLNLLCCSLEGSVVLLSFEEKELGRKLSPKEVAVFLRGPQEDHDSSPQQLFEGVQSIAFPPGFRSNTFLKLQGVPAKQVETTTSDGRRRIAPTRISTCQQVIPSLNSHNETLNEARPLIKKLSRRLVSCDSKEIKKHKSEIDNETAVNTPADFQPEDELSASELKNSSRLKSRSAAHIVPLPKRKQLFPLPLRQRCISTRIISGEHELLFEAQNELMHGGALHPTPFTHPPSFFLPIPRRFTGCKICKLVARRGSSVAWTALLDEPCTHMLCS
jgi:WD40 repeat protein